MHTDMDTLTASALDAFYAGSPEGVVDITPVGAGYPVTAVPANMAAVAAAMAEHEPLISMPPAFDRITEPSGVAPKTPRPHNS